MENNIWEVSFGFYTGILFGFRTYQEDFKTNHVLYLPFVDVCVTIYKR